MMMRFYKNINGKIKGWFNSEYPFVNPLSPLPSNFTLSFQIAFIELKLLNNW